MNLKKLALGSLTVIYLLLSTSCSHHADRKVEDIRAETPKNIETPIHSTQSSTSSFEITGDSDSNKAGALKTVHFEFDSAKLTNETKEILNNNIQFLKENAMVKIQVQGHCDERGTVKYNLELGKRRAKSVYDYYVSNGVGAQRILMKSYGKSHPIASGHDESAWAQNRRDNFVITSNSSVAYDKEE